MKIRLLLATACVALTAASSAQDATPPVTATPVQVVAPAASPARTMTWQGLIKELELTPEQVTKLETVDREHSERMKAVNRQNLPTDAKRAKVREDVKLKEDSIKEVMTAEQYKKYEAIKLERRNASLQKRQQAAPAHQE